MVPKDLILCVEDESPLLRACSFTVARAGFRAVAAENGVAGLGAFLQLRDQLCLVVSDIVMPVMNGIDMVERILRIKPGTKVLLMSAYSDEVTGRLVRRYRFPFIRKPFNRDTLIEKIGSIVATQQAAASAMK
jgi:DNA-binding NtrC family response regulator